MIREAEYKDIPKLVEYLRGVHQEYARKAKFSDDAVRKVLGIAVSNKKLHNAWVADIDGEIEGILIGVSHQLWYSTQKEVVDLIFHVSEKARGSGFYMARKFQKWAARVPGVAEIYLSETTGPNERLHKMYDRMGMKHVGHMFLQEVA